MIKPLEKFAEDKQSILHIIYRLQSPPSTADYIDDILHNGSSDTVPDSNAIGECQPCSFSRVERPQTLGQSRRNATQRDRRGS